MNPRKPPDGGTVRNKKGKATHNVFGGDDDDDDSNDDGGDTTSNIQQGGRALVNQQIAKEQAALRRRAQAALASVEDPSMYDYDGAYDSFKPNVEKDDAGKDGQSQKEERKSKYIGDLLKAAKVRGRERDAIYERKLAREQEEEDAKEEYQGKEKFITKAYKRKLEERKLWEKEQEEQHQEEKANDVTKKSAGEAFASFYGNLNRNVAVGGSEKVDTNDGDSEEYKEPLKIDDDNFDPRQGRGIGFLGGFERSSHAKFEENQTSDSHQRTDQSNASATQPEKQPQSMREKREKKVAEARIRYLQRKQVVLEQ